MSDKRPGKGSWKYVNAAELREFLLQVIDEDTRFRFTQSGYGWKEIYDRLK